ncbi:MAG: hypothetical protein IT330_13875 [Anaerolineae bacterium]|nr:hypothetical protein [Anaerolineae bacterium]
MKRVLGLLAILAILVAAVYASAAALNVDGGTIQGGGDTTLYCDDDGINVVAYGLNTYPVNEGVEYVTVNGVDDDCDGARIMGRIKTGGGGYYYTSGTGPYTPGYSFVVANGDATTEYKLYLKQADYTTQVWIPAEDIVELKLWLEGDTP